MRPAVTAFCTISLVLLAACGGPPRVQEGNPLMGHWELASAPGVGWRGFKKVDFRPDAIVVEGKRRIGVKHYEITGTKVYFQTVEGETYVYRVVHGNLICQEPPPEKIFRNFQSFEDDRKRSDPCYRRDLVANQQERSAATE